MCFTGLPKFLLNQLRKVGKATMFPYHHYFINVNIKNQKGQTLKVKKKENYLF